MNAETLKLPDIALSDLPESTKDFIIAYSATGKTVTEVIREVLDHAAEQAGFSPSPEKAA
jgi:uracil phosphoribosyltransferase